MERRSEKIRELARHQARQAGDKEREALRSRRDESSLFPDLPRRLGNYELLERLGKGGMGEVFKAVRRRAPESARRTKEDIVAVKVLSPHLEELTGKSLQRFQREFKIQRSVEHPHVVRVLDRGRARVESQVYHFIVLEFIHGSDLKTLLEARPGKRLSLAEGLVILDQVLSALEVMHGRGIVHRDLKPANVLCRSLDNVLVSDFGLAKKQEQVLTTSGAWGTVEFMAPEIRRGLPGSATAASDIYAAGVVFYLIIRGGFPSFGSDNTLVTRTPSRHCPPGPRLLDDVVVRALEPDPARRYANAAAFRADLGKLLRIVVPRPHPVRDFVSSRCRAMAEAVEAFGRRSRRTVLSLGAGVGVFFAAMVAAIVLVRGCSTPRQDLVPGPATDAREEPARGPATSTSIATPPPRQIRVRPFEPGEARRLVGFAPKGVDPVTGRGVYEHEASGLEFVLFEGGETRDFLACRYEITNGTVRRVRPNHRPSDDSGYPAVYLTWKLARACCRDLGGDHPGALLWDLPTDAQYEVMRRHDDGLLLGVVGRAREWGRAELAEGRHRVFGRLRSTSLRHLGVESRERDDVGFRPVVDLHPELEIPR